MAKTDPMDQLKDAGRDALSALGERTISTLSDKVGGLTDRLQDIADGGPVGKAVAEGGKQKAEGGSAVMGALKGAASGVKDKVTGGGGGSRGGGEATKSTNIIESIDVGVPVSVAYNQWTEFGAFPSFMKKVENVDTEEEEKLKFKAQIFLSHRTWTSHVLEQIPDERIVWRSEGEKGHVDGAVTFHEIGPNLTRILVVLEYYPQGLFEKTGNLWRAQGRRARAELRHFRRHVMTRTILEPDEVEGWRGVIEDGEVVKSHEDVVEEEQAESEEQPEDEYSEEGEAEEGEPEEDESEEGESEDAAPEDESEDEPEGEYDEDEPEEDEPEEGEPEEESEEDVPEDEYEEEPDEEDEEPEEAEPEDEYEEEPDEEYEDESEEESEEESEDEPEDEYEEEPEEDLEEEPEEQPRRRRRAS
jgi:uncharacterized membrane protein